MDRKQGLFLSFCHPLFCKFGVPSNSSLLVLLSFEPSLEDISPPPQCHGNVVPAVREVPTAYTAGRVNLADVPLDPELCIFRWFPNAPENRKKALVWVCLCLGHPPPNKILTVVFLFVFPFNSQKRYPQRKARSPAQDPLTFLRPRRPSGRSTRAARSSRGAQVAVPAETLPDGKPG